VNLSLYLFAKEEEYSIPQLNEPKRQDAPPLTIHTDGVRNLIKNLISEKASGPDNIPNRVLKELSNSNDSLSFVYNTLTSNYRPFSLICTLSKVMEHIVCKHNLDHLDSHNILTTLEHGFRRQRSCKTQLPLKLDDRIRA
jgi:hypothetical protein